VNPYLAAAIASVIAVLLKLHLAVTAVGVLVVVSVPWAILVAAVAGSAVLFGLILRSLFRDGIARRTA
jgi:hypothetical protein